MRVACCVLLTILVVTALIWVPQPMQAAQPSHFSLLRASLYNTSLGVQEFLDTQPGPLKTYQDDGESAASILEGNSLYYGLNPHLHLVLLETVSEVLSDPAPPESALRQPFGPAGPDGFAEQVEWASIELRAGLGPYERPPKIHFKDGIEVSLSLDLPPESIAVQQFLAAGRTYNEWQILKKRFGQVAETHFPGEMTGLLEEPARQNEPPADEPPADEPPADEPPTDEPPTDEEIPSLDDTPASNPAQIAPPDFDPERDELEEPAAEPPDDQQDSREPPPAEPPDDQQEHVGPPPADPPAVQPSAVPPAPATQSNTQGGFLHMPWPDGVSVVHLAYFDHIYPTVDSQPDGNNKVMTYLGEASVQYNTHDGHDYYFPDQPIGTPILAAAPGVAYARTERGNGVVILHDNGYETVYWHLDSFAPVFNGRIDTGQGIRVNTGDVLGTSGTSGFVYGTPHLHFEVRHMGRQVDPYGWYGIGPDPCAAYAGCAASVWLWHDSLRGRYDFTPPNDNVAPQDQPVTTAPPANWGGTFLDPQQPASASAPAGTLPPANDTPPVGTLSINPPDGLLLQVPFEDHVLQQAGHGFPVVEGPVIFEPGRYGQSLNLPHRGGLTYPITDNLRLDKGSLSLWAEVPEHFPANSIDRHYLAAASAHADDLQHGIYTGTLALRRDLLGPNESPRWTFWTTPQSGEADLHELAAPDTLAAGWHHFAITWDAEQGRKALYIDGAQVAEADGVLLPDDVGPVLQIGRFTYGGSQSGMRIDELAVFGRVLSADEIREIATDDQPLAASADTLHTREIFLDTNAIDAEGIIALIQLGRNGTFADPGSYYDGFDWHLPPDEGSHDITARYVDTGGNELMITRTVTLDLPPRGEARMAEYDHERVIVQMSADDLQQPIDVQISTSPDFEQDGWLPLQPAAELRWQPALATDSLDNPPNLYVRFRDANGNISEAIRVFNAANAVYLPLVQQ